MGLLERLHFGFRVRPSFSNVTKALRKEPKWFMRDWSAIEDDGARAETFVARHLLKAVEGWSDRDRKPWLLVEVKTRDTALSDSLRYFQAATRASHAFQVVIELPHVDVDCFSRSDPTVVPARTLLSQLL